MMNYWLVKSEPEVFSIDDLRKVKQEPWDGVRNYQARNYMRDEMQPGDLVLFYHSNANPSGIAGICKVASTPYPDPSAWDPHSKYFDAKSDPQKPRWYLVDMQFVEKFTQLIPLYDLRQEAALEGMLLLQKGSRLSVMPVSPEHFQHIMKIKK